MLNVTLVTTPTKQQYVYSATEDNNQAIVDFKANQNNVWVSVAFTGCLGHIKNFTL
jgi:hypothetical protein